MLSWAIGVIGVLEEERREGLITTEEVLAEVDWWQRFNMNMQKDVKGVPLEKCLHVRMSNNECIFCGTDFEPVFMDCD